MRAPALLRVAAELAAVGAAFFAAAPSPCLGDNGANPRPLARRLWKRVQQGAAVHPPHRYPFVTALFTEVDQIGDSFNCGGVLLNEKWVLTAAQCSYTKSAGNGGPEDWERTHVETGRFNLSKTVDQEHKGRYGVDLQITQPDFLDILGLLTNDVALWRIDGNATNPAAVCIDNSDGEFSRAGTVGFLAGWGRRDDALPDPSPVLLRTAIRILSNEDCAARLPDSEEGPLFDGDYQFCGVGNESDQGISAGDAGSPLFVSRKDADGRKVPIVVGLACRTVEWKGVRYSIFTRLSRYVSWINKTVKKNGGPPPFRDCRALDSRN